MSEGITQGHGRLGNEEAAIIDEHISRWPRVTFAARFFVLVLAAYLAVGYGAYRAATAIF